MSRPPSGSDGVPQAVSEKNPQPKNISQPTPMPDAEEYEDTLPIAVPAGLRHQPVSDPK